MLGKAGSMWYQAGGFDLAGFGGRMLLVAENGAMGLELRIAPDRLGRLSYMYDRYDFEPKGTGRVLELSLETPERTLAAGQTEELPVTMRLLSAGEIKELLNGT
ncbi:hypothetical protein SDC9_204483 [bioreactor metagenome]|uniref:Uncharacterized protein n=1 Tax=bioreactor metagenome TaxID=1076179 RepID=A0A645IZP3_9ZZZZ